VENLQVKPDKNKKQNKKVKKNKKQNKKVKKNKKQNKKETFLLKNGFSNFNQTK
jgi:hypothetical protein